MSWTKTVRLASRLGDAISAQVTVGCESETAVHPISLALEDANGAAFAVPLTVNTAGDLAHALEEACRHAQEGRR